MGPAVVSYPALGIKALEPEQMHTLKHYAKEVPNSAPKDNSTTGIYRNVQAFKELTKDFPTVKTLHDVFQHSLKATPKNDCLGHRPVYWDGASGTWKAKDYVWQSYETVYARIKDFGSGVMKLAEEFGLDDKHFNFGVYSVNNPEYVIADFAIHMFSLTLVALYDTLGADTSEYIINHAEVPIMLTTIDKIGNLVALVPKCPTLKVIIVNDGNLSLNSDQQLYLKLGRQILKERGVSLLLFSEVEKMGKSAPAEPRLPTPDHVAAISYTSGTTGVPKGALVLHKNVIAVMRSLYDSGMALLPTDVHISYLPLAHIYEKLALNNMLLHGAAVGFSRGDTALLMDDISALKPTIFISVPRLYNRIYERIMSGATTGSAFKQALFKRAVAAKLANLKANGTLTHSIWDPIIFSKVKAVLGGRLRAALSGSAPISNEVLNFLSIAFCAPVKEGYGQTESAAGCTYAVLKDYDPGHVGPPVSCNEIKLASVPEMKYLATDKPYPRGEIWVRGNNTKEALTEDGWLKTGDIGFIDKKGRIHIIDRKKNIFKLAQGEYVAPEKIENVYQKSPLIAQVYVHGDSLQSELVAIVVPDQEYAIPAAREAGVLPANTPNPGPAAPGAPLHPLLKTVCESEKMQAIFLKDMDRVGKEHKLKGFEFAKAVHLDSQGFSMENGLITPTFKLKRNEAADKFRPQIDAMYKVLNEKAPPAKL
ncbi:acetyl-CoA synthetase-like protein [Rhizoclosmatium globosum]|uniref:Acetyl-CoA synthetase-like protein n=1 Tax=Rhizoclosmatium globosum TaxID=329046 RepID=A0A1Y2CN66_9FUNG|nr:acetyl-CoA synthetase-like protein [Rhizoclosmatium globosum]|eukprot:ORY48443.1 acetyl-CoA synthetase-like protein [Rhizoclosmatium globosum]